MESYICVFLYDYINNRLIKKTNSEKDLFSKLLNKSDKYSFDIFFIHPFFISGAFKIINYIENRLLASLIAIVLSFVASIAFHYFDMGVWRIPVWIMKFIKRSDLKEVE